MTPIEQWVARLGEANAEWKVENPRRPYESAREYALRRWTSFEQVWRADNPLPAKTEEEEDRGARVQKLNERMSKVFDR
jgi:hypothetical protein